MEEIQVWIVKAREDLSAARILREAGAAATLAAFHCQQAVEKYIKACLVACDTDVPRTHDLQALVAGLPAAWSAIGATDAELGRLSAYAVAPRYPFFPTDEAERELPRLLEIAEAVSEVVEGRLVGSAPAIS